jgi:hypothetical protein
VVFRAVRVRISGLMKPRGAGAERSIVAAM